MPRKVADNRGSFRENDGPSAGKNEEKPFFQYLQCWFWRGYEWYLSVCCGVLRIWNFSGNHDLWYIYSRIADNWEHTVSVCEHHGFSAQILCNGGQMAVSNEMSLRRGT